jgi:predicted lysophospholipase L1 biosynthesis ABC-type transport system permease subunit
VKVDNPATLERVRTYLVTHTPTSLSGLAPRTFGEEVAVRETVSTVIDRIMNAAVLLTLLVAGASLAVAVGGGLVERKRPFTLLRLSGTSPSVLYRVVALEAVLPLAAATILAAGTGYGLAVLAAVKIAPSGTPVPTPGGAYYVTMGVGLVVSLLVIGSTLPFLGRITRTQNARFE